MVFYAAIATDYPLARGSILLLGGWNGKGIPRKVLKRIFEPFFSHGKRKGTGLGMATVKKIVEEHGGSVDVASEEGQGTVVTIILPEASGSSRTTGPVEDSTDEFRVRR